MKFFGSDGTAQDIDEGQRRVDRDNPISEQVKHLQQMQPKPVGSKTFIERQRIDFFSSPNKTSFDTDQHFFANRSNSSKTFFSALNVSQKDLKSTVKSNLASNLTRGYKKDKLFQQKMTEILSKELAS